MVISCAPVIVWPGFKNSILETERASCQIADEEEETEEIRLLRLKGRAIESMYYQD